MLSKPRHYNKTLPTLLVVTNIPAIVRSGSLIQWSDETMGWVLFHISHYITETSYMLPALFLIPSTPCPTIPNYQSLPVPWSACGAPARVHNRSPCGSPSWSGSSRGTDPAGLARKRHSWGPSTAQGWIHLEKKQALHVFLAEKLGVKPEVFQKLCSYLAPSFIWIQP